jgi:hypothetical protein
MRRPALVAAAACSAVAVAVLGACGVHDHHDRNLAFHHGLRGSPNPPTTVDQLTLGFDIINDAHDDAWNVEWAINRDGAPFMTGVIAHIEDHDYEFASVAFTETAGDHVYELIIDPHDQYDEWDEDDNVSVFRVTVPPGGTG